MALYIKIEKIKEENKTAYYSVSTQAFGGANFYIAIDKSNQTIKLYQNNDFSKPPIRVIDYNNPEEKVGTFLNVNPGVLGRVMMQAMKVFHLDEFPEYLDYAA